MRFCVFVGIAITVLILLVPQSQDALLALLQDVFLREGAGLASGLGNAASFAALAFFWAFQTFYWARFVSRLPPRPRTPHCYRPPLLTDDRLAVLNERASLLSFSKTDDPLRQARGAGGRRRRQRRSGALDPGVVT